METGNSSRAEALLGSQDELEAWLDYAATFLSNIGDYYGSGDQKFVPAVRTSSLEKLSNRSSRLREL